MVIVYSGDNSGIGIQGMNGYRILLGLFWNWNIKNERLLRPFETTPELSTVQMATALF